MSLVFVLSLTTVACNDKKACEADCKKECCEKKDAKECEPGCEKECCKDKADASDEVMPVDSTSMDSTSTDEGTTEVTGEEQAHACTAACESDPHSCPNHSH